MQVLLLLLIHIMSACNVICQQESGTVVQVEDGGHQVNFTYVIWIGENRDEVHSIKLSVPDNISFHEAMKVAAKQDLTFQFSSTEFPFGHYVHTINDHSEDVDNSLHWMLFRIPHTPDPQDPLDLHFYLSEGGVSDEFPADGDVFLFWLKDINV